MRWTFRTKVFAAMAVAVALPFGASALLLDRLGTARFEELVGERVAQGRAQFEQATRHVGQLLARSGRLLAQSPRLEEVLSEERLHGDVGVVTQYELEYRGLEADFFAVWGAESRPLARCVVSAGGAVTADGKVPWQAIAAEPDPPEAALVAGAGDGGEARAEGFVVVQGRLFLAVALPVEGEDGALGTLVLGDEITDRSAGELHELQAAEDAIAWGVGERVIASSLGPAGQAEVTGAIAPLVPLLAGDGPSSGSVRVGGREFRAVLSRVPATGAGGPVYTALLLSLRSLTEFRTRTRALAGIVAAAALALVLAGGAVLAGQVSRPVRDLLEATERVASGDWAHRLEVRSADEFGHLAIAFNKMAEDLATNQRVREEMEKERHRAVTQMVVGMAHELNTPIGIIRTAASVSADRLAVDLARDEDGREAVGDAIEAADLIQRNVERLSRLVQRFKTMSVSQVADTLETVDFPETVRESVDLFRMNARQARLEVVVVDRVPEPERPWVGFPGHLSQVILNFLTNAERYAYPDGGGGKVEVAVGVEDGKFSLVVRDFGRGIPAADRAKIFEPFFTTGRDKGGTGLGLAIVRSLVTGPLQGTLELVAEPGPGCAFRVRVPRTLTETPAAGPSSSSGEPT